MAKFRRQAEKRCSEAFYAYGLFVGTHPLPFVLVPLLLAGVLSSGLLYMKADETLSAYVPSDLPSLSEQKVFSEAFSNGTSTPFYFDLLIARKDRGPMLVPGTTDFVLNLYALIFSNLSVSIDEKSITLRDICQHCECREFSRKFKAFVEIFHNLNRSRVELVYPLRRVLGDVANLRYLMGNVSLNPIGQLEQAHVLRVVHFVKVTNESTKWRNIIEEYGRAYEEYFVKLKSRDYDFFVNYFDALSNAVEKASQVALPYFAVSVGLLVAFTIFSSLSCSHSTSRWPEAIAGVLNPLLAIVSALGLLNLTSHQYGWNSMCSVFPFIVLAIGVDDMFLLMAAWNASGADEEPERRLAAVLSDAGVSVMVTSLTNVISFVTGVTQGTPAIALFSAYAALALLLEFLFQISFFAAVLVYGGWREKKMTKNQCSPEFDCAKLATVHQKKSMALKAVSGSGRRFFATVSVRIEKRSTRIVLAILFLIFLLSALYGCVTISTETVSKDRVLLATSHVIAFSRFLADAYRDCFYAVVVVSNPPDFNNRTNLERFSSFVEELENIEPSLYSVDISSRTSLWIRDYLEWLGDVDGESSNFYELLPDWLKQKQGEGWNDHLRLTAGGAHNASVLQSFQFQTTYVNIHSFERKRFTIRRWRSICADSRYVSFNATIFNEDNIWTDMAISVIENIMQDTGVTMLAIGAIALLMSPNFSLLFWVAYFLLSVEAGVIGFLKIAVDATFEPTLITILAMSVGFSVDYFLHVSHAYCPPNDCEKETTRESRLRRCLAQVGWPVCQATIATTLGVSGLVFVNTKVLQTFFTAVITVVTLGLVHGLYILPAVLFTLDY